MQQLDAADVATVASGGTVKGLLVSYLGDLQRSAKAGVPVYRLGGGAGFVWAATYNRDGRGVLRFLTIDASHIAPSSVATNNPLPEHPTIEAQSPSPAVSPQPPDVAPPPIATQSPSPAVSPQPPDVAPPPIATQSPSPAVSPQPPDVAPPPIATRDDEVRQEELRNDLEAAKRSAAEVLRQPKAAGHNAADKAATDQAFALVAAATIGLIILIAVLFFVVLVKSKQNKKFTSDLTTSRRT